MSAPTITDKQLRAIVAAGGECRADKGLYLSAKGRSPTWFLRYTSPEGGRRREMTIRHERVRNRDGKRRAACTREKQRLKYMRVNTTEPGGITGYALIQEAAR